MKNYQTIPVIEGEDVEMSRGDGLSLRRVAEVARGGNLKPLADRLRVAEVMTTSDFAHLADTVDRGLIAGYINEAVPTTFQTLGYRRDTRELARAGGKGQGRDYQIYAPRAIPVVAEKGEYLPIDPSQSYYDFKTYKYGCQFDVSWEAWLADSRDLNMIMDHPMSWGLSARYTQEQVFTATWCANAAFFTAGNGNYADGAGSALDADSLQAGITAIRNFTDPEGNVLPYTGRLTLVVPPALEFTAMALTDPSFLRTGAFAHLADTLTVGRLNMIVNPFLPVLDDTTGNTAWYLFADPQVRPAVRYGYLQGYDKPEIWMRDSDAQRMAGGQSDPFDGSFLDDDIAFKLRFTFGADLVDWRGAYMAAGQ
mgnify:CR=1 FL=1